MAIEDYNRVIKLDADYAAAYNNRGVVYGLKGDYDKAIADFNLAIQFNQNDANAYNNRGFAYYNKENYDNAIADYTQAIELNPEDVYAYNKRGFAYRAIGDYDKAVADYEQALKVNPDDSNMKKSLSLARKAKEYDRVLNPKSLSRRNYNYVAVEDFVFDIEAGNLKNGTKVAFYAAFDKKPTGIKYYFKEVSKSIALKADSNFAKNIPKEYFSSAVPVKIYVTVTKAGENAECSIDIIDLPFDD
jgi:tetratricopeptide (TPR) repeat protein